MTLHQKIATNRFIVLNASAGHGEFQKSFLKSDPRKGVNSVFSKYPTLKVSMYY